MDKKLEKLKSLIVYEYNDDLNEFTELEQKLPFYELLDSDKILLFVEPTRDRVWVWYGSSTKTLCWNFKYF